jgi:hypothetical protein
MVPEGTGTSRTMQESTGGCIRVQEGAGVCSSLQEGAGEFVRMQEGTGVCGRVQERQIPRRWPTKSQTPARVGPDVVSGCTCTMDPRSNFYSC